MTVLRPQHSQRETSRAGRSEASRIGSGVGVIGDLAEVAAFEPVAVAFEVDDLGVVDEPVDHGGGDSVVAEDLAPPAEGFVGAHHHAGPLVARRHQLEEQVGCLALEGDVADLVDLSRARHRSTYADPVTMPTAWR